MDGLLSTIGVGQGVGIGIAAMLVLALRVLLPFPTRRYARSPLVLLLLHIALSAIESVLDPETAAVRPLRLAGLFFLLASIGRSGFLLFVHALVGRRRVQPLPKIFQDLLQGLVYAAVVLITLRAAGVEPGSLLTTSALLTAVLGLSLQDTLGNMFAGLAILAQRPFEPGDWVQFDDKPENIGRVIEMNWRAVKLLTLEEVELVVPNSKLADAALRNFSQPSPRVRRSASVWAPYEISPHRVTQLLTAAVRSVPGVLEEPPADVITKDFTERGVEYWVRYFIDDFARREVIAAEVRDRLWYALRRERITIPAPLRTIRVQEVSPESMEREKNAAIAQRESALHRIDFLRALSDDALARLAALAETRLFARDEVVVRQGEIGHELYIIRSGEVRVLVRGDNGGGMVEVTRLGPGEFFGEMSLMTGERRRATVQAAAETELLVVDKDALAPLLSEAPELAERISRVLAERREMLGEQLASLPPPPGVVDAHTTMLLDRIRQFFSL